MILETKIAGIMKTFHLALAVDHKVWVAISQNRLEEVCRPEYCLKKFFFSIPHELKAFVGDCRQKCQDVEKAIAYWAWCWSRGQKERQERYGKFKRELKEFSQALFQKIRTIAGIFARKIQNYWNYQMKKKRKMMKIYY